MVLITGGLGYLGARIAESLLKNGFKVRIASSRRKPLVPKALNECEIVKIDLNNQRIIDKICLGISVIIHLASLNSSDSEKNPNKAEHINTLGTIKILNSAKKNDISKFLYFSTSHVYGNDLNGIINEKSESFPSGQYALTHMAAEEYVRQYNIERKLNTCIFRLTNVVGCPLEPNVNCWMLIANDLCKKIAANELAELRTDKLTLRDFIPMNDILEAVKFFVSDPNSYIYGGEVINISSGKSISLEKICNMFTDRALKVLGKNVDIKFSNSENQNKLLDYCISNKKALQLGFTFNSSLEEEIDYMLLKYNQWFNNSTVNET